MFRETRAKQTNVLTKVRQPKKQMVKISLHTDDRRPGSRRQRRLKNKKIKYVNPQISREFRFIQFVYTVRNISNRICKTKTASKLEKEILEIGRRTNHVLSNIQDLVFHVVLQPLVNNDKRNEH